MTKRGSRRSLAKLGHAAVHEAGHATIARVLTLAAGGITIEANYELGEAGYSVTADPYVCEYQWEIRGKVRDGDAVWHARIMSFMAGAEAENIFLGSTTGGDDDDRLQIELMAMS
jgi:hypothetical protein